MILGHLVPKTRRLSKNVRVMSKATVANYWSIKKEQ